MSQSGDLKGMLYFDQIVRDDTRLYPLVGPDASRLANQTVLVTQSGFAFAGAGEVLQVQLIDGGSGDSRVKLYDADCPLYPEHEKKEDLRATAASETKVNQAGAIKFAKGCYVKLEGTNPQAIVRLGTINEFDYAGDYMPMVEDAA
jgi:hypothetical protein